MSFRYLREFECFLTAFLMGAMLNVAFEPLGFAFIAFASLGWLYSKVLVAERTKKRFCTFKLTACFWLGFASLGTYWVCFALFAGPSYEYRFLAPLCVLFISVLYALPMSCILSLFSACFFQNDRLRPIAFAFGATFAEWIVGHCFFGGFPWLLVGYVWGSVLEILQITSIIGIYGLSFLTFLSCFLVMEGWTKNSKIFMSMPIALFIVIFIFGSYRLSHGNHNDYVEGIKIRVVQPNIDQSIKWERDGRRSIIHKQVQMMNSDGIGVISHIIWPEAAIPFALDHRARGLLNYIKPGPKQYLISGGLRLDEQENVRNSLFIVDDNGLIVNFYDKLKLVPFGEYIPFSSILKLQKLVPIEDNIVSGDVRHPMKAGLIPSFVPLICYEAIFSGEIIKRGNDAGLIINITNDAWFGTSTAPFQHLLISKVRAIEEGKPIIRAANSGISAAFNSYGVLIDSLGLNEEGVIDFKLPKSINGGTIFSMLGAYVDSIIVFLGLFFLVLGFFLKKTSLRMRR